MLFDRMSAPTSMKLRVGGSDAVPPQRVEVGGEQPRLIESSLRDGLPIRAREDLRVELLFPQNLERLSLSVVLDARKAYERRISRSRRRRDLVDKVSALSDVDYLSWGGW